MVFWVLAILVGFILVYDLLPLGISRVLRIWVFRKGPDRNVVALTFDDGPDANYTPRLLDVLSEANVRATFFVIATKAHANPDIIRRMVNEGHQVEIHGWTHAMVPLLPPRRSVMQVAASAATLQTEFGIRARWYRPTWGMINLPAWLSTRRLGIRFITWSIMVGDWKRTDSNRLMERILSRLHRGAVIVLHDSDETAGAEEGAPESVIAMMPSLIRSVRDRGYSFELLANWM